MQANINQFNFQTPLSIDDFDTLDQLENGNYEKIYKAKYKKTGALYALSIRKKECMENQFHRLDFLREKEILYDLTKRNHPHIIKLYTDFEDQNNIYLVMELCEGIPLSKLRGDV